MKSRNEVKEKHGNFILKWVLKLLLYILHLYLSHSLSLSVESRTWTRTLQAKQLMISRLRNSIWKLHAFGTFEGFTHIVYTIHAHMSLSITISTPTNRTKLEGWTRENVYASHTTHAYGINYTTRSLWYSNRPHIERTVHFSIAENVIRTHTHTQMRFNFCYVNIGEEINEKWEWNMEKWEKENERTKTKR